MRGKTYRILRSALFLMLFLVTYCIMVALPILALTLSLKFSLWMLCILFGEIPAIALFDFIVNHY